MIICEHCEREFLSLDESDEYHYYDCTLCGDMHNRCIDGEEEDIQHDPVFYTGE